MTTIGSMMRSYRDAEVRVVGWMAATGILLLRVSLGIVFLWFGALKFAPGLSPAEGLAGATIAKSGAACEGVRHPCRGLPLRDCVMQRPRAREPAGDAC